MKQIKTEIKIETKIKAKGMPMFIFAMLAISVSCFGCGHVTETGNPCIGDSCPAARAGDGDGDGDDPVYAHEDSGDGRCEYYNEEYGVAIACPEGWGYEEQTAGDAEAGESGHVTFHSAVDGDLTNADMLFSIVDAGFDVAAIDDVVFYEAEYVSGYIYDDPADSVDGGDLIEYYFQNKEVVVTVEAEVFDSGREGLSELLDGMVFFK